MVCSQYAFLLNCTFFNNLYMRYPIYKKEDIAMKKYKLTFDETRIIIMSLIELRNQLIEEGRYTDAVDDIIAKLAA